MGRKEAVVERAGLTLRGTIQEGFWVTDEQNLITGYCEDCDGSDAGCVWCRAGRYSIVPFVGRIEQRTGYWRYYLSTPDVSQSWDDRWKKTKHIEQAVDQLAERWNRCNYFRRIVMSDD